MGDINELPRLRVAIVGGGIGGLALCLHLHKLGRVSVILYEGASKFSEIGAGIMMGWNALKVFKELDLYDDYEKLAKANWGAAGDTFFQYRFGDGRDNGEPFFSLKMPGGQMSAHRADLLQLLVDRVPKESVRFNKRLKEYKQLPSGGVKIVFADGTDTETDVLIGADGIGSTVRRLMYEKRGEVDVQEPRWSGVIGYRALIPTDKVLAAVGHNITTSPIMWLDKSRHLVHYPVTDGREINIVAYLSDYSLGRHPKWDKVEWAEYDSDLQVLVDGFHGCRKEVTDILELAEHPTKWAMFDVPDLPYIAEGDVAIMGDSAHAMTPHQGNGASQAVEDAHVLAHILSHPLATASTVAAALKAYEVARKERGQRVKELSYQTGKLLDLSSPVGDDAVEFERVISKRFKWVWGVDINRQVQIAVDAFENVLEAHR